MPQSVQALAAEFGGDETAAVALAFGTIVDE
jgi:hypothetical protein